MTELSALNVRITGDADGFNAAPTLHRSKPDAQRT